MKRRRRSEEKENGHLKRKTGILGLSRVEVGKMIFRPPRKKCFFFCPECVLRIVGVSLWELGNGHFLSPQTQKIAKYPEEPKKKVRGL